jgi:hypothetical protein
MWMWGFNVFIFTKSRVNYLFILDSDPRDALDHTKIWQHASSLTLMYIASLVSYLIIVSFGDEWGIHVFHTDYVHCAMTIVFVGMLVCPFDYFMRSARIFLAKAIVRVFMFPFRGVTFTDVLLADLMTSLVKVFWDIGYASCFYSTGAILTHDGSYCQSVTNRWIRWLLALFPFVLRMLQCFRRHWDSPHRDHILNAGKYLSAMATTTVNLLATSFPCVLILPPCIPFLLEIFFPCLFCKFHLDSIFCGAILVLVEHSGRDDGVLGDLRRRLVRVLAVVGFEEGLGPAERDVAVLASPQQHRALPFRTPPQSCVFHFHARQWILSLAFKGLIYFCFTNQVYYYAMFSNALMRIIWIVNISPESFGINISPPFLTMLVAAIEIFRYEDVDFDHSVENLIILIHSGCDCFE